MKDFRDKVAAITGAGSGIGRALALQLGREGCHLALSDIDGDGLAETARLAGTEVTISCRELDVSDREAVEDWARQVVADHGRVNLLFNNAGISLTAPVETETLEDFEAVININFWGVVYGTRAFLPHLRASGEGHIANVSSVLGLIALPYQSAYSSAKFAIRGFTETLRMELELDDSTVSASCVHPGGVRTSIGRTARFENVERTGHDPTALEKSAPTSPEEAAATILDGVRRNARRVLVGPDAHEIDAASRKVGADYQEHFIGNIRARRAARAAKSSPPSK